MTDAKRWSCAWAVGVSLLASIALHAAALDDWAGVWNASLKGKPYLILKLTSGAGRLSGTLRAGQVETDDRGNVIAIQSPPSREYPLKYMKLTGATLSFRTIDTGGDAIQYEMRLTGEGAAELRLPDAPAPLAPFALKRE